MAPVFFTASYRRFFPLLSAAAVVLLPLISGCASVAHFGNNDTIHAIRGTATTATINVKNWGDNDQLVLIPGGPYVRNKIDLSSSPQMIAASDKMAVATDGTATLTIIDFAHHPARQAGTITLQDEIDAIHMVNNTVFVALAGKGVTILDISDHAKPVIINQYDTISHVSRFKSDSHNPQIVYALANQTRLDIFAKDSSSNNTNWQHNDGITLPAPSSDFDVAGDYIVVSGANYGIGSLSRSQPKQFIDTYPLQGESKAIHVDNDIAYVADGSGGLVVTAIGDDGKLTWLGSHNKFDSVNAIDVVGDRAFVLDRNVRVASLDIARKTLPITGSFYKPGDSVVDMQVANKDIYIATLKGIEQVSFPVPDHAQISNEGINQGGTRRAYIDNNIAYVADWFSGLHIYDISKPSQPLHIANFHTPGSSKGVVVDNGYAYVGDDDHGLQIIDVSQPAHPRLVSHVQTTGLAYTLKKVGDLIYLADHRGGFHIIDVSNVSHPNLLSSFDTDGKSWAIDVSGDIAFVADDTSGVLVFDVSDPKQPQPIGQFNPDGAAEDIVVRNGRAYVSFFDLGFYILDISTPSQPAVISHIPVPGNARSVALKDDLAYVAGWESGLNIIDIANPSAPRIIGNYDTKGSAWGADIHQGHAYVWDWWGGVKVIDVSNPRQPKLAGKYHTRGLIHGLRKKGNYAYSANGSGGVQVFDIKNPLNPIWVTGIDVPGTVYDLWPSTDTEYLYTAAGEQGLQVLEISDPFYIYDLDRYLTGGNATVVREHRKIVYVGNQGGGLAVFNANEPFQLQLVQSLPIPVNDMWINNNTLFVASTRLGLLRMDIKQNGELKSKYRIINDSAERVTANDQLLVSAARQQGVSLWQYKKGEYKAVSSISIAEPVLDLSLSGTNLLVYTNHQGLLVYDASTPMNPQLYARYPATDINKDIMVHDDSVFFGGTHTIASVQLLPQLQWQILSDSQLEITLPKDFPLGNYHLMVQDAAGGEQLWPNALQVSLPKPTKPKMTMEKFKQLYQQHRSGQQQHDQ
ncbi:MAG: hypothetical protein PVG89_01070 [Gammaproteobacteria bacterium]|jgi:hypothetical protein